jgi:hypothetical protein
VSIEKVKRGVLETGQYVKKMSRSMNAISESLRTASKSRTEKFEQEETERTENAVLRFLCFLLFKIVLKTFP